MMPEEIPIVVNTCDKYCEIIPTWLTFFYRLWTLPHSLTIIGGTPGSLKMPEGLAGKPVRAVYMGADRGWAANLLAYLERFDDNDAFMMMMDDHILFELNNEQIEKAWNLISNAEKIGCVRLVPWPGPTIPFEVQHFGVIDKSLEYAISLQASMWRAGTLRDLLDKSWSPWDIEMEGSKKAAHYWREFIGCRECALNYKDYFLRGKPRPGHSDWVDEHL